MDISEQEATNKARGLIEDLGPTTSEGDLVPLIAQRLMAENEASVHQGYAIAMNTIADFCKPSGVVINRSKTTDACLWIIKNGKEIAVPIAQINDFVMERLPQVANA